jgi:hypothetical protein
VHSHQSARGWESREWDVNPEKRPTDPELAACQRGENPKSHDQHHAGPHSEWGPEDAEKQTDEHATLRLAGHSLGGALATLLALDTVANGVFPRPVVYTFASPAVGDKLFAGRYDAAVPDSWRIANRNDIIPHLPPLWAGYVHVDAEVPINSDSTTTQSLSCWHSLQTYLHTLDASRPLDAGCVP